MRAALFAAILALAVVGHAHGSAFGMSALFSEEVDALPLTVTNQRTLKQTPVPSPVYSPSPARSPSPSPPVCLNSNLPNQIVARVALLQRAPRGGSTDANYGIRLYTRALAPVFRGQNAQFATKLKYSVKVYQSAGTVTNPAQPGKSAQGWYFYRIVLDIGRCGAYKPGFINTLRSYIRKPRPGGTQVARIRVINY